MRSSMRKQCASTRRVDTRQRRDASTSIVVAASRRTHDGFALAGLLSHSSALHTTLLLTPTSAQIVAARGRCSNRAVAGEKLDAHSLARLQCHCSLLLNRPKRNRARAAGAAVAAFRRRRDFASVFPGVSTCSCRYCGRRRPDATTAADAEWARRLLLSSVAALLVRSKPHLDS